MSRMKRITPPGDTAGRLRWVAHLFTVLLVGMIVLTVVGDTVTSLLGQTTDEEKVTLTTTDWIGIAMASLLVIGLVVAWWRLTAGAILSAVGGIVFATQVRNGIFVLIPFAVIYALYGLALWLEREKGSTLTRAD